jgi:TrmH family RNA methyltransferase
MFAQNYIFYLVSKNQIKGITALHNKKGRVAQGMFIAEGQKVIGEFLAAGFTADGIFVTDETLFSKNVITTLVSEAELGKMSALTTPNNCLAVFAMPDASPLPDAGLIVALDDIRDPGNLGTIIRLCDWFGIEDLVCSSQTADCYNPKVVQAAMGSLARVKVHYTDLAEWLSKTSLDIFGTFMDGKSVYAQKLPEQGIIVMGNEANGISPEVEKLVSKRIAIPRFGNLQKTESLNVATAAAIVLSEFRR